MELHTSPLNSVFSSLISSIRCTGIICSPYIGKQPVDLLMREIRRKQVEQTVSLLVVTDISLRTLLAGATDIDALLELSDAVPGTRVVYVPRVHAKVYVADGTMAVVGSANFTAGGVSRNLEYVASTHAPRQVRKIRSDIEAYARLGGDVAPLQLRSIRDVSERLRDAVRAEQEAIDKGLRDASHALSAQAEDDLIRIRVAGSSISSIFSKTIEYVLRHGPLSTEELHDRVKSIHPDLCNDEVDRVIDGVRFGKLWKHQVRTAQQHLKRKDLIFLDEPTRTWRSRVATD